MGKTTVLTSENGTIVTAVRNLMHISTAAAGSAAAHVKIKRVEISQSGSTTLQMIRGAFSLQTAGTTVTATAVTPVNVRPLGGPASGLTGNTAPAGGTARAGSFASVNTTPTYVDHHNFNFANLNGYLWKPDPTEELWIPPSTIWTARFLADPTTMTGWTISITLEED
jgi:hypothetical protein